MRRLCRRALRPVRATLVVMALVSATACRGGGTELDGSGLPTPPSSSASDPAGTGITGLPASPGTVAIPSPAGVVGTLDLPMASVALLALFGNERLTSAVRSADGALRFEAPLPTDEATVSADQARSAIGSARMPGVSAAAALLAVWDREGRPLVWLVYEPTTADLGVVDARSGAVLGYFPGS